MPIGVTHSLTQGESQSSKGDETHFYSHSPIDKAARVKRSGHCICRLIILSGSIACLIVKNDHWLLVAQAWNNSEVPPPTSRDGGGAEVSHIHVSLTFDSISTF